MGSGVARGAMALVVIVSIHACGGESRRTGSTGTGSGGSGGSSGKGGGAGQGGPSGSGGIAGEVTQPADWAKCLTDLIDACPISGCVREGPASEPTRVCAENGIEITYSTFENASCPDVLDRVIAVYANGALCYSAIWSAGLGCENEVRTWRDDYGETIATLHGMFDRSSGAAYDSFRCKGGEAYDFPSPSGVPFDLVPFESAAACTEGRCSRAPGSCDDDSECPAHIPRCATAVNQCVVCLTDADCPAEQPLCTSGFEGGSACVGCVTDDDCPAGVYCISNLINGTCEAPDCENEPGLLTACGACRAERCTTPGEACAEPFDAYVECNEQSCASNPEGCPGCDKDELGCAHQACEAAQHEVYSCLETCTLCD